jgi:hypothetical protein
MNNNKTFKARVYFTTAKPTFLRVIEVEASSKSEARSLVYKIAKQDSSFDYVESIRELN